MTRNIKQLKSHRIFGETLRNRINQAKCEFVQGFLSAFFPTFSRYMLSTRVTTATSQIRPVSRRRNLHRSNRAYHYNKRISFCSANTKLQRTRWCCLWYASKYGIARHVKVPPISRLIVDTCGVCVVSALRFTLAFRQPSARYGESSLVPSPA